MSRKVDIRIKEKIVRDCPKCNGSGEVARGILSSAFGLGKLRDTCPVCNGKGFVTND